MITESIKISLIKMIKSRKLNPKKGPLQLLIIPEVAILQNQNHLPYGKKLPWLSLTFTQNEA
jgi:hypothetical protein